MLGFFAPRAATPARPRAALQSYYCDYALKASMIVAKVSVVEEV
jgi:hypothetical protein